jgi:2Fe-2S ferredoxin
MARITYIEDSGAEHAVEVSPGMSVMEGAVRNGIPGIDADCGGACACATCQVYIDERWREIVGGPSEMEAEMLDLSINSGPGRRLSCQIAVSEMLDGLIVRMPESQQ